MRPSALVRADFVTGLFLVVLGAAALIGSLEMPRFEERAINPYTVPGLVPGLLSAVILVLGTVLTLRGARAGGWRIGWDPAALADPGWRRLALALLLCVGYAAGLVGAVPFWLATFLFVSLFTFLFEWPHNPGRAARVRAFVIAVAFGALVALVVTYVFQEIFLVRLP